MIFLIQYHQKTATRSFFKTYADSERLLAESDMLAMEIDDNRQQLNSEIVLLQAQSEAHLRQSHSRYFGNLMLPDTFDLPYRKVLAQYRPKRVN